MLYLIITNIIITHLQVNLYIKRINSAKPSEDRILWTTASLNFGLPILQSLDNLQISKNDHQQAYQKYTQQDSHILHEFLISKFEFVASNLKKIHAYEPHYWEEDISVDILSKSPSSRLNKHYTDANEFVERHYKAVVEDFAIFGDPEVEDDDEDTIEPFAESDF